MKSATKRFSSTLIAPLLLTPVIAFAQVDTSDWKCESCPFEKGYRASVDAGATYVGEDGAIRFGNATGYDDKGGFANLDGQGRYVSEDYHIDWMIEDLGLDSRVFEMDGGKQGTFGFHVGYRELPYRRFDTSRTVFNPSTSGLPCPRPGSRPASPQTCHSFHRHFGRKPSRAIDRSSMPAPTGNRQKRSAYTRTSSARAAMAST